MAHGRQALGLKAVRRGALLWGMKDQGGGKEGEKREGVIS